MRLFGLILLCLSIACSEGFVPAWAVTNLRVVGALVEVDGKPGRARPDPGDEVQVTVLVIDQGAPPSEDPEIIPAFTPELLRWALFPCIPLATLIGPPICRTPIEPCDGCEGAPADDRLAFPVLRFPVPDQAALDAAEADSVLVQGAVCIHGVPSLDVIRRFLMGESDELEPCVQDPNAMPRPGDPEPEGRFVAVQVPIETSPEDPNLNPEISTVNWAGGVWPPPYNETVPRDAPRKGCLTDLEGLAEEDLAAHPIAGDSSSSINLIVTPQSLQPFMVEDLSLIEEMQVSWLTDGGELERTFSFITDPARSILTQWRPPPSVSEAGELVRFNFVIRDGRGGTSWVERGLCVRRAPFAESPP